MKEVHVIWMICQFESDPLSNNKKGAICSMCQQILDQDREELYPVNLETLQVEPNQWGVNLLMEHKGQNVLLGTFDNVRRATKELKSICTSQSVYYPVKGYSNGGFASW